MILIVGGSGRLGRATALRLLAQGKAVRVMTRSPSSVVDLEQRGVEIVSGDLRNPAQLHHACQGIEQVLAAAHALNGKGNNNPSSVDNLGNRHLIDAARTSGVKHYIFISIQGASPDHSLEFFRIKYAVEDYLRASRLDYTILRPSAYMDLWGELIGVPILEHGKVTIFGSGENPINFISVDNVAEMVCMALEDQHALNRTIDLGGPQNLTMNEVAQIFEKLSGHSATKRYIPLAAMRVMSLFMRPINPTLSRLAQNGVYMDQADLRFDTTKTNREFPLPLTFFEDWSLAHFGQK